MSAMPLIACSQECYPPMPPSVCRTWVTSSSLRVCSAHTLYWPRCWARPNAPKAVKVISEGETLGSKTFLAWDVTFVLFSLVKEPFETLLEISLKQLTFKTVFLTVLTARVKSMLSTTQPWLNQCGLYWVLFLRPSLELRVILLLNPFLSPH